ncbi:MAG: 4Fe-4S dicluster domain-containing protein, partial [Actinobacteria bacterium]|nr:4Fe-4S dicluster domain-containing protein [Actinomycetota bacterium]
NIEYKKSIIVNNNIYYNELVLFILNKGRRQMLYKVLDKKDFKDFVVNLIAAYEVTGPKKINQSLHDFVPIKNYEDMDLGYKRTTLSPAKKMLFPSVEALASYKVSKDIEVKPLVESKEQMLFGASAWDINGMNFLDRIFSTDFIDENYMEKRKKLKVIGIDAEPSDANFAVSMNAEYAKEGFDLFLSDIGDKYFVRLGTAAGAEIAEKYGKFSDASDSDYSAFDRAMIEYKKKFKVNIDLDNLFENLEIVYGRKEFWNKLAEKCFSCGSCNLVCPTCFCFNVRDDMKMDLSEGVKSRQWDSCMISNYGLVAGGHNFRPDAANRLKQRYRCKLKTYVEKFGQYSCIGCGRCVEACLAKINIYEDINAIKEEVNI